MTRQEEVFCHDHQERSKVRDEVLPHLHPFPLGFGSAAEDRLNDGGPYPCPTEESRWGRPPYPSELKKNKASELISRHGQRLRSGSGARRTCVDAWLPLLQFSAGHAKKCPRCGKDFPRAGTARERKWPTPLDQLKALPSVGYLANTGST